VASAAWSVAVMLERTGSGDAGDLAVVVATTIIWGSLCQSGSGNRKCVNEVVSATANMARRLCEPAKFFGSR
jgi:hypothetical protein